MNWPSLLLSAATLALAFSAGRLVQFQFARAASRSMIVSSLAGLLIGLMAIGVAIALMPGNPASENATRHRF